MLDRFSNTMRARSAALLVTIDQRLNRILLMWLLLAGLASAARIAASPLPRGETGFSSIAPYLLLILAPFFSTLLALHWFKDGERQAQPTIRLARIGRWRDVPNHEAQRNPLYGPGGLMVSLLVGMMLNVPVRAAEYLAAMPPLPVSTPHWLSSLRFALTLDAVLFTSVYMVAAVAALRRVPLFPRLLLAVWIGDLLMQMVIAQLVTQSGQLPPPVAAALHALLEGNVKKVLISIALWLPYLLLSKRVNVTYRSRIPV
jgi:hypothetical protein